MEQGVGDFLMRYESLIGVGLVVVCLYILGTAAYMVIQNGLRSVAVSVSDLATRVEAMSNTVEEQLQELNSLLNSMHTLFGGRLYRKDDLPKEVDGPTIQELLQSIESQLSASVESSREARLLVP